MYPVCVWNFRDRVDAQGIREFYGSQGRLASPNVYFMVPHFHVYHNCEHIDIG